MRKICKGVVLLLLLMVMVLLPAGIVYASQDGIENDIAEENNDRFGTTSPWLSGTENESIYENPVDAGEGEQDISVKAPGRVEKYIAELVRNTGSSLISLLQDNIGASIDSIIYGRVGSGYPNKVNIYAFELRKGNPYGVTAAVCYALLRGMMFIFLGVQFVFQLAKAAWSGQTAKSRDEIKSLLPSLLIKFSALILMPYLLDVTIYVRDVLLYGIKEVTGQMVAGGATLSLSKAFLLNAERSGTFVDAVMYLGTVILTVYFVFLYVAVAIDMLVCFVSFPFICVFHSRKRDLISGWIMTVFSNLMTPVIDAVLLLIPLLTSIMLSDVVKGVAVIQLVMCMLIIPARVRFKALLGIQSNERNGFLGAMAVMTLARALASRVKQGAGKIADAISDARKSRTYGEMADVDREEEEALLSGDSGNKENSESIQGGNADGRDALQMESDQAEMDGESLRTDSEELGADEMGVGDTLSYYKGMDSETASGQNESVSVDTAEMVPSGNTKGDALREMDRQIEQSQNTLDGLRIERADMVQKDKQLRRQMLNHERGSEQYNRLEKERANVESQTAAIDTKIARESSKLNRLRTQSREFHAAFGMRNTPTQFEERRAAILQKRANIANFEQPEFRGVLSNEQMRNLYRNRAIANTIKTVTGTGGSVIGGVALGSSALFLGGSGVAMAASGGIHAGGSVGEAAVDVAASMARVARPVAKGVGSATYHAADMAASAYLMHKVRPEAMHVSMDLGNIPLTASLEVGDSGEGSVPVMATVSDSSQNAMDVRAQIVYDTNNVIARTISNTGTAKSSTMLHALQQANVQLEREIAIAREEGSVILTEETIHERRTAIQTDYLMAEIMAQMETRGYQRNTETYVQAEELIRDKIQTLLAERDKPLI